MDSSRGFEVWDSAGSKGDLNKAELLCCSYFSFTQFTMKTTYTKMGKGSGSSVCLLMLERSTLCSPSNHHSEITPGMKESKHELGLIMILQPSVFFLYPWQNVCIGICYLTSRAIFSVKVNIVTLIAKKKKNPAKDESRKLTVAIKSLCRITV